VSPRTPYSGKTLAVLIASDKNSMLSTRQPEVSVALAGFNGDKHAGFTRHADGRTPYYPRGIEIRNDRQVSIVSNEELEQVALALAVPQVLPEWLGANLLLAGIPNLSLLPPNTRLIFQRETVLVVQYENNPCTGPGRELSKAYQRSELESEYTKAAFHLRGLVACVERPGVIQEGDPVVVEVPER